MSRSQAGMDRLRALVAAAYTDTVTSTAGTIRPKTAKQRQIDKAVAEEVVRFAFDHGGYAGSNLAPAGLWDELRSIEHNESRRMP